MSEQFHITIKRQAPQGALVSGTIYLNGTLLGKTYENDDKKIPAGNYAGLLRYRSDHHFVQGPKGIMDQKGDFLIEVSGVENRTNILLHTGNQPGQSAGCILLGPINSAAQTGGTVQYSVAETSPLRALRLQFYGTDEPTSSPLKTIKISIVDTSSSP
jgi:hypothetical protein